MKKRILILLSFFLIFTSPIYSKEEFTIARGDYGDDYPPYYIVNEKGETSGVCHEVIDKIAGKLNLKVKYVGNSWPGSLKAIREGRVDGIIPVSKTPERVKYIYYFDNILVNERVALFSLKERDVKFSGNFHELENYKIGVIRNYSYGIFFDSFKFPNKDFSYNENHLVKRLIGGRTDIIVSDELVLYYKLKEMDTEKKLKVLKPYVSTSPVYLGFSIAGGKKKLALDFSKEVSKFRKTVDYKDILKKYGL